MRVRSPVGGVSLVSLVSAVSGVDYTQYVNVFVGTQGAIAGVSSFAEYLIEASRRLWCVYRVALVVVRSRLSLFPGLSLISSTTGNMFPGVAVPFGQVKLGIDTSVVNLDQGGISSANSGYTPRGNSTGFSMLHTSGTGGRKPLFPVFRLLAS